MMSRPSVFAWGVLSVALVAVLLLAVLRACDRRDGALSAAQARARATADSLRLVVRADSLRSAEAAAAAARTKEPLRVATTRADTAGARSTEQIARLREAQDAARRAAEDSLSGVVQLVAHLRRLNEESSRMAIAYLSERDARLEERRTSGIRIAALEAQAAADSVEKEHLYGEVHAREREIAAQEKALKCKIGPFPCPSRLTSGLLGVGLTLATVVVIAF